MPSRLVALLLSAMFVLAACTGAGASPTPAPTAAPTATQRPTATPAPEPVDLTVFAAASLKNAMEQAVAAYGDAFPNVTITLATDSSSALRTQIEQGAPVDVFLSADTTNPKTLVDAGLATGQTTFAGNELVIIVPAGNPAGIASAADLGRAGVKVIAAAEAVPIQKYTVEMVGKLAAVSGMPADIAALYTANIVSREDNVSAVRAKIELGEGDAAVVYVTDAKASGAKVATVAIPTEANVPATYDGVVVADSSEQEAAAAFLEWLAGPDGQAVLAEFGFLPPA